MMWMDLTFVAVLLMNGVIAWSAATWINRRNAGNVARCFIAVGLIVWCGATGLAYGEFTETDLPADPPEVPYVSNGECVTYSAEPPWTVCKGSVYRVDRIRSSVLPEYDRSDWKHWTDDDRDGLNTRHEVINAESRTPVRRFVDRGGNKRTDCDIICPFTGEHITDCRKADVDHLVPLKEAHLSGGWAWSPEKKRAYANDMDDPDHLVVVRASANRQKGAKDPGQWLPLKNRCQYAIAWKRVKERWELSYDEDERRALDLAIASCPPQYGKESDG